MKSGVVLLFCAISTHVLVGCVISAEIPSTSIPQDTSPSTINPPSSNSFPEETATTGKDVSPLSQNEVNVAEPVQEKNFAQFKNLTQSLLNQTLQLFNSSQFNLGSKNDEAEQEIEQVQLPVLDSGADSQPPNSVPAEEAFLVKQDVDALKANEGNGVDFPTVKSAGVFVNFTREILNRTILLLNKQNRTNNSNSLFNKSSTFSDETEHEAAEDVRIQDLLRGILADEFGSDEEPTDLDSDEPDVFHDDSEETHANPDSANPSTEETSSSVSNVAADLPEDDDTEDDEDEGLVAVKDEAETDEVVSDRDSRAEVVKSEEREGRSRETQTTRRGSNNKAQNRNKKINKNTKESDESKYNRYVDAVFKGMNTLIRNKRMDPLRVNLYAGSSNGNGQVTTKIKKNGNRIAANNNNNNKGGKNNNRRKGNGRFTPKNPKANRRGYNNSPRRAQHHETPFRRSHSRLGREESSSMDNKMRPSSMETLANKTSTVAPSSEETVNASAESKEMKPKKENSTRPTRGVLQGLSTLRRTGPVKVIRNGKNTRILHTKFRLGPVALQIQSKKNSTKAGSPSATATARSLNGVLEIRLKNSGPTRIRRLRVFPPADVRVEGESNGMKKQGYRKITPVAARRLMSVANQVVRQSDRRRTKPNKTTENNSKVKKGGQKRISQRVGK